MKKMSKEAVAEIVKTVIEKKGADYVYPGAALDSCRYFGRRPSEPSCIVGHVFRELGMTKGWQDWNEKPIISLPEEMLPFTPAALNYLECLQVSQDSGDSWGEAHKRALKA